MLNLNSREDIKKFDSDNMLGSIESLGNQAMEIFAQAQNLKIPKSFKSIKNVVVLAMGGSTLGTDMLRSVYASRLTAPVQIVNNYHIPAYVNSSSLVIVSTYSGTTEESLAAMQEAKKRKAKLMAITSGGELAKIVAKQKIPALVFTTNNNPCGSPRMGLGYAFIGMSLLLSKVGVMPFSRSDVKLFVSTTARYDKLFGVASMSTHNPAKQVALATSGRSVWFIGAEHLSGSVHVAANQMNENGKRFAGYFLISELNHHLMEGMLKPKSNRDTLLFVFVESAAYDARIQKRFAITKNVLDKNNIAHRSYVCQELKPLAQAAEMLVFSSYVSFYSAVLEGIDPTAIPYVDYFKEQLKK